MQYEQILKNITKDPTQFHSICALLKLYPNTEDTVNAIMWLCDCDNATAMLVHKYVTTLETVKLVQICPVCHQAKSQFQAFIAENGAKIYVCPCGEHYGHTTHGPAILLN